MHSLKYSIRSQELSVQSNSFITDKIKTYDATFFFQYVSYAQRNVSNPTLILIHRQNRKRNQYQILRKLPNTKITPQRDKDSPTQLTQPEIKPKPTTFTGIRILNQMTMLNSKLLLDQFNYQNMIQNHKSHYHAEKGISISNTRDLTPMQKKNEFVFPNPTNNNNGYSKTPTMLETKNVDVMVYQNQKSILPSLHSINSTQFFSSQHLQYSNQPENIPLSKSYIKRQTGNDIDVVLKDIKEKIFHINKTLYEHESKINQIKESKLNYSTVTSDSISQDQIIKIGETYEKAFQRQTTKMGQMMQKQIQRVKCELVDRKKQEVDFRLNNLDIRIMDRQMELSNETKTRILDLKREFESIIINMCQCNKNTFSKIQKDMFDCRQHIEGLRKECRQIVENKSGGFMITGNFFDSPKILKYRQTLQSMDRLGRKQTQEICLSQELYFIDKEGHLLDRNGYYLIDRMNRNVKMEQKHLKLLRTHKIIQ